MYVPRSGKVFSKHIDTHTHTHRDGTCIRNIWYNIKYRQTQTVGESFLFRFFFYFFNGATSIELTSALSIQAMIHIDGTILYYNNCVNVCSPLRKSDPIRKWKGLFSSSCCLPCCFCRVFSVSDNSQGEKKLIHRIIYKSRTFPGYPQCPTTKRHDDRNSIAAGSSFIASLLSLMAVPSSYLDDFNFEGNVFE